MEFNFEMDRPIYIQLVEHLKSFIILGRLEPGSRIPSVREFALQAKVNPNTMQKALMELEGDGLIYTERTNGKFVTENSELIEQVKNQLATQITSKYIESMKNLGISKQEATKYLQEMKEEEK